MSKKNEIYMEKEKICFIIMPISDNPKYPKGHFKRVYEHLIKPACLKAKFRPVRADEILSTNYIALDIIKTIISAEMSICDLSSLNPNVLYELGIRQAFNKPVTILKDSLTKRIFDIQGIRDIEYDENLRIDNVENEIELLAETISNTYKDRDKEINSLVKLLGITPAKIGEKTNISTDTELILSTLNLMNNRIINLEINKDKTYLYQNKKTKKNDYPFEIGEHYTLEEFENLKKNTLVYHKRFGIGEFLSSEGKGTNIKGNIEFAEGKKKLLLMFANLQKVLNQNR